MTQEEALAIGAQFHKSLQTGDISLIEGYSIDELRQALSMIPTSHFYTGKQWYKEIERRIQTLEKNQDKEQEREERRKEQKQNRLWSVAFFLWSLLIQHIWKIATGFLAMLFFINILVVNNDYRTASTTFTVDNRKFVNFTIQKLNITPDKQIKWQATAQDAVTGDSAVFVGAGKLQYLLTEDGYRLTTEDGNPIIIENKNEEVK